MACRNRQDVVQVLERAEQLIFEECQRGAFNTSAHKHEREAIKAVVRQMRLARMIVCPKQQADISIDQNLPLEERNGIW